MRESAGSHGSRTDSAQQENITGWSRNQRFMIHTVKSDHDRQMKTKYVFVCGMHRSGTTILAKCIGGFQNCTTFENTGAIMDEGQHLQDVYAPDYVYGGVGKFGFSPHAHLTESSPLLTRANISRLQKSWEKFWDAGKSIRIEKTPGNLLMTRFLQVAFPNSHFVVIKRHPVAVSLASQKWSRTSLHSLFEHWLQCHKLFEDDKKHLSNVYELRYEDFVEKPEYFLKQIAEFIGTEFARSSVGQTAGIHNNKYFARWAQMLETSSFRSYYRSLLLNYEKKFGEHGYSLLPEGAQKEILDEKGIIRSRSFVSMAYITADTYCRCWDLKFRLSLLVQQTAKRYCPPKLRTFFAEHKASLARKSA
jgi:hypothetical protein